MTWVFTALVTECGQAWADSGVYMPKSWAKDPERRKKAGIRQDLAFATKPELAIEQMKRVMASGTGVQRASADEVRAASPAYVVIVPAARVITLAEGGTARADQAVRDAVFERRPCGNR